MFCEKKKILFSKSSGPLLKRALQKLELAKLHILGKLQQSEGLAAKQSTILIEIHEMLFS